MFKIKNMLSRDSGVAANDEQGPIAHDIVPLIQTVQSREDQLENAIKEREHAIAALNDRVERCETELQQARVAVWEMTYNLAGEPPGFAPEKTVTLVTTPEQDQQYLKTEFEG